MELPVTPPIAPMLGRLVRELPEGDEYLYEPKWDGFRCIAFRAGDEVDLRSRHGRPLARYFPEVVAGLREVSAERFVVDGELVVLDEGRFDFGALMARLHPAATRVQRLARETPAAFVAFDLLALGDESLCGRPFVERRGALVDVLGDAPAARVRVTPITAERAVAARWLERFQGAGIDGVIAKLSTGRYQPGARAMLKVKHERTAECVVAGFRLFAGEPVVGSLLLGLYDQEGDLHHVGVVTSFTRARRRELFTELSAQAVSLEGHPWEHGYLLGGGHMGRLGGAAGRWDPDEMVLDWVPLAPERVCEVAYDQVDDARFRHPARFRRWRPDRDARSCLLDQLACGAPLDEQPASP
jgi:ATP-dependent DNA ligase